MIDWRPKEMPTLLIARLARQLAKMTDDRLREVGLTAAQLPVLAALKDGSGKTQKELAEITSVEQPSMAQLLARMERDGLVRRGPSPHDRRSSIVELTDLAVGLLEPGREALLRLDQEACSALSPIERDMLIGFIRRLAEGRESVVGDD